MKLHWDEELHLSDFVLLNNAWIEKYFQLEAFDRELANDPARILRNGGHILSVTKNDSVVGVCALFQDSDDTYELARMAVSETAQGQGIGSLLLTEIINFSNQNRIKRLYLISNTLLEPAINLYKKFDFETISTGPHPVYKRGNIVMEKILDHSANPGPEHN